MGKRRAMGSREPILRADANLTFGVLYSPLLGLDIQYYGGYSLNRAGGLDKYCLNWFTSLNPLTAKPDPFHIGGVEGGFSLGLPIGGGFYITQAVYDPEWSKKIQWLLPIISSIFDLF